MNPSPSSTTTTTTTTAANNSSSSSSHQDSQDNPIVWTTKHYSALSLHELYAILQLRSQVFVVEQGFRFLEMDGKDHLAYHIMAWRRRRRRPSPPSLPQGVEAGDDDKDTEDELIATSRLFAKDVSYEGYQAIGRVATSEACRGLGIGKQLMHLSVSECARLFGDKEDIKINAQYRLKSFYELFGFQQVGEVYWIEAVEHITMVRYSTALSVSKEEESA